MILKVNDKCLDTNLFDMIINMSILVWGALYPSTPHHCTRGTGQICAEMLRGGSEPGVCLYTDAESQ